jgi:hypothetical protein
LTGINAAKCEFAATVFAAKLTAIKARAAQSRHSPRARRAGPRPVRRQDQHLEKPSIRRNIMRLPFRTSLVTLALVAGIDITAVGIGTAVAQSAQQGSQREQLNLNSAKEQAVTQGLANQPARSVPGYSGQVGSKLPSSETAQKLPNDVQAQVPEAKELLFVKLPDRILLIDPDTQLVAEIVMAPVTTGSGSSSAPSPAPDSPSR